MLSLSFMGGRLAYYVLEGVSFVLARSRRALLAWLIPQGEPFVFDARSVLSVREHDKRARTPLAAFFNIPSSKETEQQQPASVNWRIDAFSVIFL
jgi:hypothetical protein